MTSLPDISDVDRPRWEQAALWREAAIPRLRSALDELHEARAGMPISTERIKTDRAIVAAAEALREASNGASSCRNVLARNSAAFGEKHRPSAPDRTPDGPGREKQR